jgi:hypothetical protein
MLFFSFLCIHFLIILNFFFMLCSFWFFLVVHDPFDFIFLFDCLWKKTLYWRTTRIFTLLILRSNYLFNFFVWNIIFIILFFTILWYFYLNNAVICH